MTRAEQRGRTRERLLDAAEQVFLGHGFHATSVDEIAEEAGFSKGAVYSNFESKDQLFLGVLERRIDSRALAIETGIDGDRPISEQAVEAGDRFFDLFLREPEWSLLLMEYAAHAARHEELRSRFASRNRRMREGMAALIDHHLGALGLASPVPTAQLATILFSLGSGIILEKLTDPDGVPDDTFSAALGLLFTGLGAGLTAGGETSGRLGA